MKAIRKTVIEAPTLFTLSEAKIKRNPMNIPTRMDKVVALWQEATNDETLDADISKRFNANSEPTRYPRMKIIVIEADNKS
ncbi:hypothetical protein BdWA1_001502 [Babesia duncani]|uniref:Uncharacterized protein n=1 Tax=Babesia duncani TaxID=323732 RepID=A0AAD9PKA3_9APIC|nr:hypothetical protein BdWA1_001502 [Babesia duncani]